MKKIILLAVLALFLIGACSRQNPEELVGQGMPVPDDKLPAQPEQEVVSGDAAISEAQQQESASSQQENAPEAPQPEAPPSADAATVKEFKLTARQFSFEPGIIEVNKGDKVRLVITSMDVPHGFSIREYGINERLDVGKPVTIEFTADKEGTFTAFCSVFCGSGHSNMKGKLIVR